MKELSKKDHHAIHDLSLRVLEEIGIDFLSREAVEIMRCRGLQVEGQRVFLSKKDVEWATKAVPESFVMKDRMGRSITIGGDNMEFVPCYGSPFVADRESGVREGQVKDYVTMAKLIHGSPIFNINGGILVQPCELEGQTAPLAMFYLALQLSDKCMFSPGGTAAQLRTMTDMYRIVLKNGPEPDIKPDIMGIVTSTSPLRYDSQSLDVLMEASRLGQPVILIPGATAGLTAPVSLFGASGMCNAEFLAGLYLSQALNEGTPIVYGWPASGGDMTKGTLAVGGIETMASIDITAQMSRFYGIPSRTSGSVTDAPVFGPQSACESIRTMAGNFQHGINVIVHAAGGLDCLNIVSFEKFAFDEENLQSFLWLHGKGYLAMEPDEVMEDIRNVGHGGAFIQSEATLQYFREALFTPRVALRGERWDQYEEKFQKAVDKKLQKSLKRYKRPPLSEQTLSQIRQKAIEGGLSEATLDYLDNQIG